MFGKTRIRRRANWVLTRPRVWMGCLRQLRLPVAGKIVRVDLLRLNEEIMTFGDDADACVIFSELKHCYYFVGQELTRDGLWNKMRVFSCA